MGKSGKIFKKYKFKIIKPFKTAFMDTLNHSIPFLDLKGQYTQIRSEVLPAVEEVFERTAFTNGFSVQNFEKAFAEYCGTKYSVAVNSGTSALHLAMLALGIGPGDEVIIPANTFIATAWGPSYVGATPVFVDCDPETWQIDPSKIEEKITSKTKAIIGVHLYGQAFDVDSVKRIAEKHNLFLVEDAAQAQGTKYKGVKVGGFGEMACFSHYPGKNLGTYGEGGSITTNNDKYYNHLCKLRNHSSRDKYYHDELGFNMRMGGVEGAVLGVKLKYLDQWNARRNEIAEMYFSGIKNPKVKMQMRPDWAESIYHLFVITTPEREILLKYLNDYKIFPGMHYPVPCHLQKAYAHLGYKTGDLPNAEYLAEHCLSLPMYAEINMEDVDYVINVLNQFT
jgi:dTDP-4-amino-4,6-dideoxygalactose transaminase